MPNPWDAAPSPDDTAYGGVEQALPSSADIAAASPKPLDPRYLKYTNGDGRSPQQVLAQYSPQPYKDLPEPSDIIKGTKQNPWDKAPDASFGSSRGVSPWDNAPTSNEWDHAPTAAASAPPQQQQPWYGDPAGDISNKAHSIASGIANDPVGWLAGIGISVASMAGMGVEGIRQGALAAGKNMLPLPILNKGVTPTSIMKDIGDRGQQFSDAVFSPEVSSPLVSSEYLKGAGVQAGVDTVSAPWAMTGGYVANKLEEAGYPQMAALINLAGVYSMYISPKALKGKGEAGEVKPTLSPDQQATFDKALKGAVDEAQTKTQSAAPMLEDQSALEAKAKATPEELGRVEPTLTDTKTEEPVPEPAKTAPEPLESKEGTETPPTPKDTLPEPESRSIPEPPGTSAIPEGSVRLYHQTIEDNLPAIQKEGLIAGKGVGAATGDPMSVYASEKGFYGPPGSRPTIEFQVPKERVGANGTVQGNVAPENIIATHLPWHDLARAIEKDPALIRKAVGGFLDLGKEDKPAIDYIKEKYSDEKYGPNKISPLGGVGKKQGGGIILDFGKTKEAFDREQAIQEEMKATLEQHPPSPGYREPKFKIGDRVVYQGQLGRVISGGHTTSVDLVSGKTIYAHETELSKPSLGGVGSKGFGQGGAIKIFSVTDKPQRAADYETAKAVVGRMDMTVEEYAKLHPELPTQDTNHRIGLQTGSFRTKNELKSNYQNKSHAIWPLSYMDDTMHLLTEHLERFITTQVYPHKEAVLKYYRADTLPGFATMHKTLQADAATQLWFERNPGEWFDGKNYSPTKEQLMGKGMSPESADVALHDYAAAEAVWPQLVEFTKEKGIDEPSRIPGWVPHFTQGAWQVRIFKDSPEGPKFFGTVGARNRWEANRLEGAAKNLINPSNPDHAGLKTRIDEPKPEADMASMISGLFEAQGQLNNKGLTQLMQTLYEQSSIGSLKQSLERQATPQILHQMDRISTPSAEFQLSVSQARSALLKKMQIYDAIPAMNMRGHYVRDYLIPMESKGYFNADVTPKAVSTLQEFNKQFLHISDRSSAHIDGYFTDQMAKFGINPQLPIEAMRFLVGSAAKFFLYGNMRFYAQTMLQKALFLGAPITAKADLLLLGIKDVSVNKAILKDIATTSRGTVLSTGESLHAYTEHTGHATPTFVENLDTGRFAQDPVAMGVERYVRQGGERLGYNLFNQVKGWSEKDALNASGAFTDAMNGPYDRQMGKPNAFMKEGQMLSFATLFLQWPMHFFQFMSNQSRTVMSAYRAGDGKAFAYAAGGFATTLGTMAALGGLGGMPWSQNYNWLAQWFNTNFGNHWPTTAGIARAVKESMLNHNFGDEMSNLAAKFAEFGSVSTLTGYDFSGSLQGPSVSLPEAFPHFLNVLMAGSIMAGRWAFTKEGVSTKDLGSLLPDLPGPLRGSIAEYLRGDTFKDLMDKVQGKRDDYAPSSHDINLQGNYKRTPVDTFLALLNLRSIGESAANTTIRLHNAEVAADSLNCARLLQNVKESPNNPKMSDWLAEMTQLAMRGTCNPLTVKAAIEQYAKEKEMPGLMREMYAVTKAGQASAPGYKGPSLPEDKLKWERLQQMRLLEPK